MAAQILIELVPDTTKLKSTLDSLQDSGAVSGDDAASFKAGNAELEKRNKLIDQNAQKTNASNNATRKELASMKDVGAGAVAMSGAVARGVAQVTAETNKGTKVNKEHADSFEEVGDEESKNIAITGSLRAEKKKLTEEIGKLILRGEQESQTFRDLTARAGDIDDAMKDAADAISRTGSDTRGLDNALLAARGVAAGFSVVAGATAIFGVSSEKVEKILATVNGAMAVLNGLQEIQNILKSEYVKTLIASITAQKTQVAVTETEIVATEGATVAQLGLNAAVLANPYVAAAAAIIAIVAAIGLYISASDEAEQKQKDFDAALDPKKLESYQQGLQDITDLEIALMKLRGDRGSVIAARELQNLEDQHEATERRIETVRALGLAEDEGSENRKKAFEEYDTLVKKGAAEQNAIIIKGIDNEIAKRQELNDRISKDQKDQADISLALAKKGSKAELDARIEAIEAARLAEHRAEGLSAQDRVAINAVADRAIADARKEFNEQQNLRALESSKARAEIQLAQSKEGSRAEVDARIAIIKAGQAVELANEQLTADQRKAIRAKSKREIDDLNKAFNQSEKIKALENLKAIADAAAVQNAEFSEERQAALETSLEDQRAIELAATTLTAEQRFAINIKYDKLIADSRIKHSADLINNAADLEKSAGDAQIAELNRRSADITVSERKRFQAAQEARQKEVEQIEKDQARLKALREANAISEQDFAIQSAALDTKLADKKFEKKQADDARDKAIRDAAAAAAIETAQAVSDTIFEIEAQRRQAELDAQVAQLDAEKQAALNNKNLTEAQKAEVQLRYDKQLQQLKNEAAKKERRAQTLQAIVNTALAVTSALTAPPPLSFIAAALAAALGLVQIARINSTPLPAYRKGGKNVPAGMSLVGEEGPELIRMKGGEDVFTAKETDAILKSWKAAENERSYFYKMREPSQVRIDYEEIGKAVARHMPELATVNMIADEEGLSIFLETQANRRTIRNRRYTTGL